uniref:Kazal-like domain-containing protein n=1 Tax=Parascaris equorum TaxID=6256 RepID=A0A914RMZ7_PAREQ
MSAPKLPDAFIEEENAKCNMSKLCTYDEMNVETICGTDGRTYNSICEIKRAICHGNPVEKKIEGPCPESLRCLLERSFQLSLAAEKLNSTEIFIPECNASDGSYAKVQVFVFIPLIPFIKENPKALFIICYRS